MNIEKRVTELVEEKIADMPNLFLVDVKMHSNGKLIVLVDGDNGIGIADCAAISRHVGFHLEEENVIEEAYNLEVSSPGIDTPLGMGNTLALSADMPKALNRTVPHTLVDNRLTAIPYCNIDGLAPAGAISSSANDMSKWVMALLNDGKVGNRQVIPAAAIQATRQPQDIVASVKHLNGETNFELYGLGWEIQDYSGHRIFMHDGGVNGYVTSVTLVPQDKLGIIVLTNTDQNQFYDALRWEIMDAYFKQKFRNYSEVYLAQYRTNVNRQLQADKKLRDTIATTPKPKLSLSDYAGKYNNEFYGNMTITQGENNILEMRFEHHQKMYAKLQPLGGNRFYVTFSDPTLGKAVFPFYVTNNKVTGVRVKVADFIEYNPYDFKKVD
jgi:hypothetical protein